MPPSEVDYDSIAAAYSGKPAADYDALAQEAGATPDEQQSLASPNQPVPGHPAERLASGMVRGGLRAINPLEWAKAAGALGKMGLGVATQGPYSQEARDAAQAIGTGLKETGATLALQRGPEAFGEVVGEGLAGAGLQALTPGARFSNVLRRSRATNIVRAIKGGDDAVMAVHDAGDAARLPISLTQGSLARKLAEREAETGAAVGTTRAVLPGNVPYEEVAKRIPEVGSVVEDAVVTGDRGLLRATESGRRYWEELATRPGTSGTIPRAELALKKTEAGGAAERGGAYKKGRTDQPIAPGAAASMEEASAIRGTVLDKTGLSPADAALVDKYEKALGESSIAQTLSDPSQAYWRKRVKGESGDWKAALAGRVLAPGLLGGTAGAALGGGIAASPLGALMGVGVAEFMRSTPWHTLSAATKLQAIKALESGGTEAFRKVVIPAAIADIERRRTAEQVLAAQGEGVTAP